LAVCEAWRSLPAEPELACLNGIGMSRWKNGKAVPAEATYPDTNWATIAPDHIAPDHIGGGHKARLTRLTIE